MRQLFACALLLLGGCHDRRPPGPSAEQSSELNEADQMLNNMDNEEGPEANAPDPSNVSR